VNRGRLVGMGRVGQVGVGAVMGRLVVTDEAVRFETDSGTTELRAVPPPALRIVRGLVVGRLLAWNPAHRRWDTVYAGSSWRGVRRDLAAHGWAHDVSRWTGS
jgi:hypothetical protein